MILHAVSTIASLAIGMAATAVIIGESRAYWRKALAALRMEHRP